MNKVRVTILGKQYLIMGAESDEYIQKVGLYVDKKLRQVEELGDSKLSTLMVAVLGATNISDDYFKERDRATNLKGKTLALEKQLREFNQKISNLEIKMEKLTEEKSNLKMQLVRSETELGQARNPQR
ncbi:MAG: cell division protein ZapA [Clostridiales bacterium]|nr:cell division protein ZapA [Clostridiales bacterium]